MANNSKGGAEGEQFRKLFIGGLSLQTTEDGLKDFYGKYGTITDCVVMRDGATKKSRGFGFVTYSDKTMVDSAMKDRPHTIDGKTVDPKRAVPREQSTGGQANVSTQRLYVSGVREDHTEEHFKTYFSEFGSVQKVEIITDKNTGKNRGFAFISFEDYDSVDRCVLEKSHQINGSRCDVKKALSRDEMAKAQQSDRDRMERGNRTRGGNRFAGNAPAWQGNRGGPPAGNFREPHGYGGNAPNWNSGGGGGQWQAPPQQQGNWGGYGAPPSSYGAPQQAGNWSGGNDWSAPQTGYQPPPQQSQWGQQPVSGYGQGSGGGGQWSAAGGSQSGGGGGGQWKGNRY